LARATRVVVVAGATLLISDIGLAADSNAAQLEKVRQRLQLLQEDIARAQQSRSDVRQQLAAVERKVSDTANRVRRANQEIAQKEARLRRLKDDKRVLQRRLGAQQDALARQVRASYVVGRQDYLKLLLNQEKPSEVGRVLTYYRYFDSARARQIDGINKELDELDQVEQEIANEVRGLAELSDRLAAQRRVLVAIQTERRGILDSIDAELRNKKRQLDRLREDERQLAALLERLRNEFADIPAEMDQRIRFARLKGKLPWPARGRIIVGYGAPRGAGQNKSQGIVIDSEAGAEVRAVAPGRVAFADWLYGYGMVLILEHGDGYMSLYANNESLVKEVGDWTEAGEIVAAVGNTGGRKDAALYFEIRHNGKPDNPARWFKK
jgi:septal ring factor EnvC (AmiA/AmiB activator)